MNQPLEELLQTVKPEYPHLVHYSTIEESQVASAGLEDAERSLERNEAEMARREDEAFRPLDLAENIAWARELRAACQ